MKLTAIIYPDSETDLLVAECPEIGTASQGHTEAEALANLQEATDLYLIIPASRQEASGDTLLNCSWLNCPSCPARRR